MNSDGDAAGAGRQVVPRQRALPAFIHLRWLFNARDARDHKAGAELLAQRHLESPIPCLEVGWLVQHGAALLNPFCNPGDHFVGGDFGAPKRPFAFVTSLSRALAPPTPETNSARRQSGGRKSSAISLTASAAVPVMFKTRGGD